MLWLDFEIKYTIKANNNIQLKYMSCLEPLLGTHIYYIECQISKQKKIICNRGSSSYICKLAIISCTSTKMVAHTII